jgi:hypothetical protein
LAKNFRISPAKNNITALIVKPQKGLSTADVFAVADNFERTAIETQGVLKLWRMATTRFSSKHRQRSLCALREPFA